ncbi:hypothetical protein Y032_0019g3950 [Ancylostoma ceylanicum]|uniref:Uncharacterized protein n=1 Tax=Ancylostoma ceylanicum TaxID=53326 RepID=A0A016V2J3_9BILA|nr:hypothetical protein Y032_0019g3950 [Ancylostoma ceylanicum]
MCFEIQSIRLESVEECGSRSSSAADIEAHSPVVQQATRDHLASSFLNDYRRKKKTLKLTVDAGLIEVSCLTDRGVRTIPPMAPMKRRHCQLCGKRKREDENRWAFRRRHQSAVLISALLASYNGNSELLKGLYEQSTQRRMKFCHQHFIDAAQFMGAEMMLAGFKFPQPDDILFERTIETVGLRDIPSSLLHQLNAYVQQFDENLTLAARDVAMFMRDSIKKYYTASGWMAGGIKKQDNERKRKGKRKVVEELVDDDEDIAQTDCEENCAQEEGMKMEEESLFESCQVKADAEPDQWEMETSHGIPLSDLVSSSEAKRDSQFSPVGNSIDYGDKALNDANDAVCFPETDPSFLNGFFLVQGVMLMQLFMVCQQCSARLSPGKVRLSAVGTAPVVQYYCPRCSVDKGDIKCWEGQRRSLNHTREGSFLGNILTVISAVVTGTRFWELQQWAKQLRLSFISNSFFYKWFFHCKPSIEKVYVSHQQNVFDLIRRKYAGKGLHLTSGSSFNSRGRNGIIGNVAVADLKTRLVLHTEVLHRLGKSNTSSQMELEGLRKLLQWLSSQKLKISSITTGSRNSPMWSCLPHTLVEGSHAFEKLGQIGLNKSSQKELSKTRLRGGCSIFKTKNALDRLYRKRKVLYPLFTYKLYAMLSTMHFNTLAFAEVADERRIERGRGTPSKFLAKSRKVSKPPVVHAWRDTIVEAVLEELLVEHGVPPRNVKRDTSEIQGSVIVENMFDRGETKDTVESFYELGD